MQEKITRLMQQTMEKFSTPSLSVSVLHQGKEYHIALGKADVEADVAATPDSIYCIGSSTKAFIATALCILADEGKLDLDAPVKNILPWFRMYDPYMTENLTPRDALSHRSGMPRHDLTWLNTPTRTTRQLVNGLAWLPPAFTPRTRFHYQNHMFVLATLIVETLTGAHWSHFVSQRIWQPLGMASTWASGNLIDDAEPRKARPYALDGGKAKQVPYNYAVSVGGAGSIYSTTTDMLKWLRFRIEGDESILSAARLKDMHTPQMIIKDGEMSPLSFPEIDFTAYGLAWMMESYRGVKAVHHGGTIDGFKSQQLFLPAKGVAVSALANLNGTQAVNSIAYKICDLLLGLDAIDWDGRYYDGYEGMLKEMQGQAAAKVQAAKAKAVSCEKPEEYTGLFTHPAYGDATFAVQGGTLTAAFMGQTIPAVYAGGDSFMLLMEGRGMCFDVTFVRDNGKISAVDIVLEEMVKDMPARFEKQ